MQFSTLISQVQSLEQAVKILPSAEQYTVYYDYNLNQFVEETSPLVYLPTTLEPFDGYCDITIVPTWNDNTQDQAMIDFSILGIKRPELPTTLFEIRDDYLVYQAHEIKMNFGGFKLQVNPWNTSQPSYSSPSHNILKLEISLTRCNQYVEVL